MSIDNGTYKYAVSSNNTISILGLSENATQVDFIIPGYINGREVVQIVNGSFKDSDDELLSIYIPITILEIKSGTFGGATNLHTVTFEEFSQLESKKMMRLEIQVH